MPEEVRRITTETIAAGIPGEHLGIHTHNDTENAVACTPCRRGRRRAAIQGTLNGLGERCGNANLTTLIPILLLKEPYASAYETGITHAALKTLTRTSPDAR